MTGAVSEVFQRVRCFIGHSIHHHAEKCFHCCECEKAVSPWDPYCPHCGQADPSRVSKTAVVYLVIGFVLVALVLSSIIAAF